MIFKLKIKVEDIMKIFIYIGTRSDRRSKTFEYIRQVLQRTIDIVGKENVKIDMHITSSSNVHGCIGCLNCFFKGKCPQDKNDDMEVFNSEDFAKAII